TGEETDDDEESIADDHQLRQGASQEAMHGVLNKGHLQDFLPKARLNSRSKSFTCSPACTTFTPALIIKPKTWLPWASSRTAKTADCSPSISSVNLWRAATAWT